MVGEDPYLRIEWTMQFMDGFWPDGGGREPDSYVASYEGRIIAIEDDEERRPIGRIHARRCLLAEASPFFVLDAEMELDTYVELFTADGWFRKRVADMPGDLLVLDRLGLAPEYRGRDLGLAILLETIRELGSGCAVVAMIPFALAYDHTAGTFTPIDDPEGTKKLQGYYQRLGFRKLGEILYFDLSRQMKLEPPIGSLD